MADKATTSNQSAGFIPLQKLLMFWKMLTLDTRTLYLENYQYHKISTQ